MLRWSGRDAPGLPEPARQAIRREPSGRRRYLDVEFRTRSGRRLVVEVDGALHLVVRNWWSDLFRQIEVVISDSPVLRFPSAFVRHEEALVIGQLRRALDL
jgi:very-short-patch-repair endonuclease